MLKKKKENSFDKNLLEHIKEREWGNFDNKGMFLLIVF